MALPTSAIRHGAGLRRSVRAVLALSLVAATLGVVAPASVAAEVDEWLPAVGGSFVAVGPSRLVDSRQPGQGPCVSGERVVAVPAVPAGAGGVVLNVTVTGASSSGFVSVYAAGAVRPGTSVVNFSRGATVDNAVTTAVGAEGIAVFASGGCPQVIVDLVGYYAPGKPARGGSFSSVAPARLVDTRQAGQGPCVSGERVVAVPGVPEGAGGVVLNVTVTGARSPGFVSVFAAGAARPSTSSLNFVAGQTVANGVTTALGEDGVTVFASGGCPHVIVDLVGSFTGEAPVLEGSFAGVAPSRLVDTRKAGQGPCVSGERTVEVPGVPEGATGAVVNVTVTGASSPGFVSTHAAGASRPATSTLNFTKGRTTENGATTAIGQDGLMVFASGGCPHVIVDLVGWYSGEPEPLTGVVDIGRSGLHTCAVIDDGTVRCWGADHFPDSPGEQLGDGRQESSAFPVPVLGIDDAVSIDVGIGASCAVHAGGTVSCWGWDLFSPASPGDQPGVLPTTIPGLSEVETVTVGEVSACAVKADGTVWCWGYPGILGQPWSSEDRGPVQLPRMTDVVQVEAGYFHTCARVASGDVSCWGAGYDGDGVDESGGELVLTDAVALATSQSTTCAIRADETVWCWGSVLIGVIDGVVHTTNVDPTQLPDLSGAVQVVLVDDDVCVSGLADQLICKLWTLSGHEEPRPIGNTEGAVTAAGGEMSGCVVTVASHVRCWGDNRYGLLGDGTVTDSDAATTVIRGIEP